MICPNCGTENTDYSSYCVKCGSHMVIPSPYPPHSDSKPDPPAKGRKKLFRIIWLSLSVALLILLLPAIIRFDNILTTCFAAALFISIVVQLIDLIKSKTRKNQ